MRRLLVAALAATALASAPSGVAPASASGASVANAACISANIGGQRKCIGRGQYCARAYQRDYKGYGFSCSKRDRNGRYHLV